MEYGEFNSINTSLVEYERTTKKVPTMKPLGGNKAVKTEVPVAATKESLETVAVNEKKIDF